MKTFKFLFLVLIICLGTASCSSDDDGGNSGEAANGTIQANPEGSDNFQSSEQATSAQRVSAQGSTTLIVTGSDTSGRNITLQIIGFDAEGTYDMTGGSTSIVATAIYTETDLANPQASPSWSAPYSDALNGEINISSVSETNVQGTFSFTGRNNQDNTDLKTVSNGSFNVDF